MSTSGRDDTRVDDTLDAATQDATSDPIGGPTGVADHAALPTGNRRYRLGDLLGQGGMGEILLATDAQIGRDVAIKRLRKSSHGATDRFMREARIQGRLDHPAIVPVHEVSVDDDGRPYFVMKRLSGTTLADIIASDSRGAGGGRQSRQRLLRAFADVCLAVEFAHSRGVIHRDLKPANIMLGDFGEAYVLDWGVARVTGDSLTDAPLLDARTTMTGAILGTPGYMPPEQATGEGVDRRADVYALGCILFELLAGVALHEPRLTAVLEDYDARPSVRAPSRDIPPELDAACVAATARDPEDRPSSARELGALVESYLDGDRDVGLRQRLASEHVARARAALLGGDKVPIGVSSLRRKPAGDAELRDAMQHAGRALALDPTSREAAELVGRLMLEPPGQTPAEVEAELDLTDDANIRDFAGIAKYGYLIGLVFLPVMYWVGARDLLYLGVVGGAFIINLATAFVLERRRVAQWMMISVVVNNMLLVAIVSRMFTPFLVAPGLAIAATLGVSMYRRFGHTRVLVAAMTTGVLGPWLAEWAGWLPRTVTSAGGALVFRSPAGDLTLPNMEIALAINVLVMVALVGMFARSMVRTQHEARRAAHLQAWHLRHLVPAAGPAATPARSA